MVWYSHLFENFPQQSVVIHSIKGFGVVNKQKKVEVDVFLELHRDRVPELQLGEMKIPVLYRGILKEMGIPDHLTSLLRNVYADQEATVRTGHGTTDWFQIGKEYVKAVYCHPDFLTYIQSTS